jgi:hypothetical protein
VAAAATTPAPELDDSNSWAFTPPEDGFTDDAVLDLRYLNEEVAGQSGFVALSEDGNSFVRGDGEPIRFWSVVTGLDTAGPEDMDTHCRFLAKLGVNMVRFGLNLADNSEGAAITDVNEEAIDDAMRFVAAAKKHGIYTLITPFWAHTKAPASWGLEGIENQAVWGIMFFNQKLQDAYKAWVRELYTQPNPYTGRPLSEETAVAVIQIKNEDSLLFYTFQGIPEPQRRILRRKFADWLRERYGSLEAAMEAWDGTQHEKDNLQAGEVGLFDTWRFAESHGERPGGGRGQRMADQLHFLAWTQHKFYSDMEAFYRDELGCGQLINAMNWKSGDPVLMEDAERWSYTANEVIALNRYTGVVHVGQNNGYRIDPGHFFASVPVVRNPETFPGAVKQVAGRPFIITESAWVHPARYQTAGPLMAAAYNSLTGVDSLFWFSASAPTWELDPRRMWWHVKPGDTGYAIHKWTGSVPQQMGMFPACALAFRRGYIRQADEPAVHEERRMEDIWHRRTPIISEAGKYDPNRDAGNFAVESAIKQEVNRLAFLVGPVEVKYGGDPANNRVADLSRYIDEESGVVRSITGQVSLDHKVGVCSVNAPGAQGVAGFLRDAGGRFALGDVTIESDNEYATIVAVAVDGRPLAESERVLVQVGTVARLTGWTVEDATFERGDRNVRGKRILQTGKAPWRLANTRATLTIENPNLTKATLLDEAGYAERPVTVSRQDGRAVVELPKDTMYLVLE